MAGDHKVGVTIVLRDMASKAIAKLAKGTTTLQRLSSKSFSEMRTGFKAMGATVKQGTKTISTHFKRVSKVARLVERDITAIWRQLKRLNAQKVRRLKNAFIKLEKQVARTNKSFRKYLKNLGGLIKKKITFSNVVGATTRTLKRFGIAIAAVGAGFLYLVKRTAAFGDQLAKTAPRVGVTAQEFQKLDFAMKISGTSMQVHRGSLTKFARTARDATTNVLLAADAFKTLGVEIHANNGDLKNGQKQFKRTYELLLDVADGFDNKLADGIQKSAVGMDLFGRSGAQLLQFLNLGSDGIQKLADRFERLGGVMDDRALALAQKFIDALTELKVAVGGAIRVVTVEFMGALANAMVFLAEKLGDSHDEIRAMMPAMQGWFKAFVELFRLGSKLSVWVLNTMLKTVTVADIVISKFLSSVNSASAMVAQGIGHVWITLGTNIEKVGKAASSKWSMFWSEALAWIQGKLSGFIGGLAEAIDYLDVGYNTKGLKLFSSTLDKMSDKNRDKVEKTNEEMAESFRKMTEERDKSLARLGDVLKPLQDAAAEYTKQAEAAVKTLDDIDKVGETLYSTIDSVASIISEYVENLDTATKGTKDLGDAGRTSEEKMRAFEYALLLLSDTTRKHIEESRALGSAWDSWDTTMRKNKDSLLDFTNKLDDFEKAAKIAGYAGGKAMGAVIKKAVEMKLITSKMAITISSDPSMFESAMDKAIAAARNAVSEIGKEFDNLDAKIKETASKIRMYIGDPFEYGTTKAVSYFRTQERLGESEVESRANLAQQKTEIFRKVAAGEMDAMDGAREYSKSSRDLEASILKDREDANKNFWRGIRDNIIDTVLTETIQKGISVAAAWWESGEKIKADAAQLAVKTSTATIESGLTKGATVDSILSNQLVLSDTLVTEGGKQTAKGATFGLSQLNTQLSLATDVGANQAALASKTATQSAITTIDAAGTAAEVTGVGVATTAVVTGESTKLVARETTTIASIMMYISESIAAVFAAIAAIPIIGPFIAPVAAIGAGVWLGGKVLGKWAEGGMVTGGDMVTGGQKGKDSVLGALMPGEYVMTTTQVGMMQKLVGSMENTPTPMKFASGGLVTGGTPGRDSVSALLTPGEYVLTVDQVDAWKQLSGALSNSAPRDNSYAEGGPVRRPAQPVAQTINQDTNINLEFKSNQLPNRAETKRWIKSTLQPALKELGQQGMLSASGI